MPITTRRTLAMRRHLAIEAASKSQGKSVPPPMYSRSARSARSGDFTKSSITRRWLCEEYWMTRTRPPARDAARASTKPARIWWLKFEVGLGIEPDEST